MQYRRSYDHFCVLAPYAAPIDKFCYFLISCVEYMYYLICSEVGCKLLHRGEEIREPEPFGAAQPLGSVLHGTSQL